MLESKFIRPSVGGDFSCVPYHYKGDRIWVKEEYYYWHRTRKQYQKCPQVAIEKRTNVRKAQQRNFRLLRLRGAKTNVRKLCYELGIKSPNYIDGFFDTLEKIILQEPRKRS